MKKIQVLTGVADLFMGLMISLVSFALSVYSDGESVGRGVTNCAGMLINVCCLSLMKLATSVTRGPVLAAAYALVLAALGMAVAGHFRVAGMSRRLVVETTMDEVQAPGACS